MPHSWTNPDCVHDRIPDHSPAPAGTPSSGSAAVLGANVATSGSLRVAQFLVLDRFLLARARQLG